MANNASHEQDHSISPPPLKRRRIVIDKPSEHEAIKTADRPRAVVASPVQLTKIRDLPDADNEDAISLSQLLGDESIFECWQFNFCFDVDFLLSAFHPDTRGQVKIKIVHGSWKFESENRKRIDNSAKRHQNVEVIRAWMPDPFGTHHSKMMIIFRTDDTAQVVIHTANMLSKDWANMCQGVWRSPRLPLVPKDKDLDATPQQIGKGGRFKHDLLRYLESYGSKKTGDLTQLLQKYDFSSVRAALVASVPSKTSSTTMASSRETAWGIFGLQQVLEAIPKPSQCTDDNDDKLQYIAQISSIATLTDSWISSLFSTTMHKAYVGSEYKGKAAHHIVFPSPLDIRESLDGYQSGGSIHTKVQSTAQRKQMEYMRPMLRHWSGEGETVPSTSQQVESRQSGRKRAAPHIKTYICFANSSMKEIKWSLLTSANLSKQAWGQINKEKELWIQSYEIGVLVWPDLFGDSSKSAGGSSVMIPTFKSDKLSPEDMHDVHEFDTAVAYRMPFDLPLRPYKGTDIPWCASMNHHEPDNYGQQWIVH